MEQSMKHGMKCSAKRGSLAFTGKTAAALAAALVCVLVLTGCAPGGTHNESSANAKTPLGLATEIQNAEKAPARTFPDAEKEPQDAVKADQGKQEGGKTLHIGSGTLAEQSATEAEDNASDASTASAESNAQAEDAGTQEASRVYTDSSGAPLTGAWRYEGSYCVFDDAGHLVAGGGALGTKGRLYIPSGSISVAVNRSDDATAQYYTDLEDSAAYVRYDQGRYYIADHNTQGFSGLTDVSVGDVAYLVTDSGIEAFTCTNSFIGHNTGSALTDSADRELSSSMPTAGFTAYTCLDSWINIQVTYWQRSWTAVTGSSETTVHLTQSDASGQAMEASDTGSGRERNGRGFVLSIGPEGESRIADHEFTAEPEDMVAVEQVRDIEEHGEIGLVEVQEIGGFSEERSMQDFGGMDNRGGMQEGPGLR